MSVTLCMTTFTAFISNESSQNITDLGPDFRRVVMLRNGAVRTKQNLSTAHEFVVC